MALGGPAAKIRFFLKLGLIRYPDSDVQILKTFFQGADRPLNGYQQSWWLFQPRRFLNTPSPLQIGAIVGAPSASIDEAVMVPTQNGCANTHEV